MPGRIGERSGRPTQHPTVGIAVGSRYVGVAVLGPRSTRDLLSTRLGSYRTDPIERIRLRAWIERTVVEHGARLVALFTEDGGQRAARTEDLTQVVRAAVEAQRLSVVEVARSSLGVAFGVARPTNRSLCNHVRARDPALRERIGGARAAVSRFRSERERYWEMPTLAFGAAMYIVQVFSKPCPNS